MPRKGKRSLLCSMRVSLLEAFPWNAIASSSSTSHLASVHATRLSLCWIRWWIVWRQIYSVEFDIKSKTRCYECRAGVWERISKKSWVAKLLQAPHRYYSSWSSSVCDSTTDWASQTILKQGKTSVCKVAIACKLLANHFNRHFRRLTGVKQQKDVSEVLLAENANVNTCALKAVGFRTSMIACPKEERKEQASTARSEGLQMLPK